MAAATSSTVLAPANSTRIGLSIWNGGTGNLYITTSSTSSTAQYTVKLVPGAYWELPYCDVDPCTGVISGIWDALGGFAYITEYDGNLKAEEE